LRAARDFFGTLLRPVGLLIAGVVIALPTVLVPLVSAMAQGPRSVAPIAARLTDAVVNISTLQRVKGPKGGPLPNVPHGSPFEDLFQDFFKRKGRRGPGSRKISSLGSGFVIDGKAGLIVTNNHVIAGADEITIIFRDGRKLRVDKVVGRDTKTDLALLKVTPKKPLKSVKFGSSDLLRVGDWVMAIGNPFGLGGSVSVGIISAKQRDIRSGPYDDYLQTDAAINKGNSGGPLFNMDGEVIGVNTAIISPTGGSIGIGFAVPAEVVVSVIDQLKRFGETRRGWIGVNIQSVTEDIAESLGVSVNTGALVAKVADGGPAAKAGIVAGDLILRFNGKDVKSVRSLPRIVARTPHGKTVDVDILRNSKPLKLSVKVGRLEEKGKKSASARGRKSTSGDKGPNVSFALAGMTLEPLSDSQRKVFGIEGKVVGLVVVSVKKKSVAAREDIRAGNVIVEASQKAVRSIKALRGVLDSVREAGRKRVLLRIEDAKGNLRFVAVPFD